MPATANKKPAGIDLEKTLKELEGIVEALESGDMTLDKSLQQFEKGVELSRRCQAALQQAEQKVQVLTEGQLADFDPGQAADQGREG